VPLLTDFDLTHDAFVPELPATTPATDLAVLDPAHVEARGSSVIGVTQVLPAVSFRLDPMGHRVDTLTDTSGMTWMRLSTIGTETGERSAFRYEPAAWRPGSVMPASAAEQHAALLSVLAKQPQVDQEPSTQQVPGTA